MERERKIPPKRLAMEKRIWRCLTLVSYAAIIASLLLFDGILGGIVLTLSILFMLLAQGQYNSYKPDDDGGYTPWYYGAL